MTSGKCRILLVTLVITATYYAVVRASAYGTGGPGFDSRGRFIPKTLKMVVMASLLGAQEFRVSITTDSSVSVKDDRPQKPQGDSKSAVLSLNGGLLPKIATPWKTRRQGERKEITFIVLLKVFTLQTLQKVRTYSFMKIGWCLENWMMLAGSLIFLLTFMLQN